MLGFMSREFNETADKTFMASVVEASERRHDVGELIVTAIRVLLSTPGNELAVMVLLVRVQELLAH